MSAYLIFISIISIIIGYLLGSILPAYIIGRLKGVDIRKVGSKNAGTSNVYHELGLKYAVLTGFYDFFKGLLAIWISSLLQANFIITQLAGYAAIIGHVFPFYINFRGGQGLASSMALLIYYMITYIFIGTDILVFLLYLLLIVILYKLSCKVTNLIAILIYPLISYFVWVYYPTSQFNIFTSIILAYIIIMALYNIIKFKKIEFSEDPKQVWWKLILNPSLMIFVILFAYLQLIFSLILIGLFAVIIGSIDFFKFFNQNQDENIVKRLKSAIKITQEKEFIYISIILFSMFLTMLIFGFISKIVVIITLTYFLIGDIFGRFFRLAYGKRQLLTITLEEFMGYVISGLILTFIFFSITDINPLILLLGGLSIVHLQLIPFKINKNLVIPLFSCFLMLLLIFSGL
jgi:glycerol-3-phosphate acyltransferase PlsY